MVLWCCVKDYRVTVSDWFVLMIIISSQSSHWLLLVVWICDYWHDLDDLFILCWGCMNLSLPWACHGSNPRSVLQRPEGKDLLSPHTARVAKETIKLPFFGISQILPSVGYHLNIFFSHCTALPSFSTTAMNRAIEPRDRYNLRKALSLMERDIKLLKDTDTHVLNQSLGKRYHILAQPLSLNVQDARAPKFFTPFVPENMPELRRSTSTTSTTHLLRCYRVNGDGPSTFTLTRISTSCWSNFPRFGRRGPASSKFSIL